MTTIIKLFCLKKGNNIYYYIKPYKRIRKNTDIRILHTCAVMEVTLKVTEEIEDTEPVCLGE